MRIIVYGEIPNLVYMHVFSLQIAHVFHNFIKSGMGWTPSLVFISIRIQICSTLRGNFGVYFAVVFFKNGHEFLSAARFWSTLFHASNKKK